MLRTISGVVTARSYGWSASASRLLTSESMPLVRIDVLQGYSPAERRAIGDCVQRAMTETVNVPARDRFQIVNAHGLDDFDFNRSYLDNNVVIGPADVTAELMRKTFETNVFGTVRVLHAFLPLLQGSRRSWSTSAAVWPR